MQTSVPPNFKRVVCLVCDGFGVGEAPDAKDYGDEGSNTLLHTAEAVGGISLPNLEKLGMGNLGNFRGISKNPNPLAVVSRLAEKSAGKDTTTGHWEIAGLVTSQPFRLFPNGFPKELVDAFVKTGNIPGILGNRPASGTVIIEELGEESLKTGKPIVYTSGDSVFQIAAHEEKFGLDRLYALCETARKLCDQYQIGRVIARPFIGDSSKTFKRTSHRRDYSVPPGRNCLDVLQDKGVRVISVGKIEDIFDHRGIHEKNHTGNNLDSLDATMGYLKNHRSKESFIFTNLVDFDQLYGHRRDPKGYARSLVELDQYLPKILTELTPDDLLVITSDHGCDPTFKGTDHTREYVPLIAFQPGAKGMHLPDRNSFADIGASVLEGFQINDSGLTGLGSSFLCKFQK